MSGYRVVLGERVDRPLHTVHASDLNQARNAAVVLRNAFTDRKKFKVAHFPGRIGAEAVAVAPVEYGHFEEDGYSIWIMLDA